MPEVRRNPLDILRARTDMAGWIAVSRQTQRREIYFNADETEAERTVEDSGGTMTVFVDRDGRRGRSSFAITPGGEDTFPAAVDRAVFMAGLGGEDPYPVAGKSDYTKVLLLDAEAKSTMEFLPLRARSDVLTGLANVKGVRLAAGEFFVSMTKTSVVTSAGAAAQNDVSDLFADVVLTAGSGSEEQERHFSLRRKRYEDLDLAAAVTIEAERAMHRLSAKPPTPGEVPVILGPEILGRFLGFVAGAASGRNVYKKESCLAVGANIFAEGRWAGDPLTVNVNALYPYGPASYRIDNDGVAGQNLRIIEDGVFVTPHADPQYAHYLKLPAPSGAPGTIQLLPGTASAEDLRSGDYLEVIQFSDLIPSPVSGQFSAEIRFGYEVRGGQKRPVAGGVLSGNIREAFANARYSSDIALHDRYSGPGTARVDRSLRASV